MTIDMSQFYQVFFEGDGGTSGSDGVVAFGARRRRTR